MRHYVSSRQCYKQRNLVLSLSKATASPVVLCWWSVTTSLVLLFIEFLQIQLEAIPFSFHSQTHTFMVLHNFIFSLCLISCVQHSFGQQGWKAPPSQSLPQTDPAMSLCLSPLSW